MADVNEYDEIEESENNLDYKINNVVATVHIPISERLDLVQLARKLYNSEYNPEKFPGIIIRQENPKSTFLLFSTGKMVLTGLKNVQDAQQAVSKLIKTISETGVKLPEPEIVIQNLVASGDLHTLVDLNTAVILMEFSMYEPEIFPGLIYRSKPSGATFLIFSTGKFVCSGVKTEEKLRDAVIELQKTIRELDITEEKLFEGDYEDITFL